VTAPHRDPGTVDELAAELAEVTVRDGGDGVTVTVDGLGAVRAVEFDAAALEHPALLGRRVVAAVERARRAALVEAAELLAAGGDDLDPLRATLAAALDSAAGTVGRAPARYPVRTGPIPGGPSVPP
jgi:DNA-binding protein YbaB